MSKKTREIIHDPLLQRSKILTDPAGGDVEILEDEEAWKIAEEYRLGLREVYFHALSLGIYPCRYLRNRETISLEEQLALAKSRVAVIGAGGLGGHVILLLARIGIGRLVVVDPDIFDESNLNRQALCAENTLGKSKSEEAAAAVAAINPGVEVSHHQVRLDSLNSCEILTGSDVLVDGLDSVPDRFILQDASKKLGIPLVYGALAGFEGQLMTIFPDDPGLRLLYGDAGSEKDRGIEPDSLLGVPAIMPCLIAAFQAMEVLKVILKRGRIFRNIMARVDLEAGQLDKVIFQDPLILTS